MVEECKLDDCPVEGQRDRNATFNGTSWQIRIKFVNDDGEVGYALRKGFVTADEANRAKEQYDEEYRKAARKLGFATNYNVDMPVKSYFEYYLQEILAPQYKSSTEMVYRYALYKYIIPNWKADPLLSQVREDDLNELLDKISDISKMAANKAREFIFLALRYACVNERRIDAIPEIKKCPRPASNIESLNKDEIKMLLAEAQKTNWYIEILLALFLGMRKGEIRGLKFGDFDEATRTVRIQRQICEKKEFEESGYKVIGVRQELCPPKSATSNRAMHVPDYIWQEMLKRKNKVISDMKKVGVEDIEDCFVSCQKNGKPSSVTAINTALNKICHKSGIKHISVHGLRHCYASILLERGYEISIISKCMGHSSVDTTFSIYADIVDADAEIKTCLNELYAVVDE